MKSSMWASALDWKVLGVCLPLLGACASEEPADDSVGSGVTAPGEGTGSAAGSMGTTGAAGSETGTGTGSSTGGAAPGAGTGAGQPGDTTGSPVGSGSGSAGGVGGGDVPPGSGGATSQPGAGQDSTTGQPVDPLPGDDGAGGAPSGQATCAEGIDTGSVCDPSVDTAPCQAGGRDCTCGANAQWACAGASEGGSGGTPSAGAGGAAGDDPGADPGGAGGAAGEDPPPSGDQEWLPSWGTTNQRTEDRNEPPPLGGKTLRQFVFPSYSGSEVRIQLSNERGNAPAEISKVHIAHAQPLGQGQIDTGTDAQFTFGGSVSVTIPQGETVWSDPLPFELVEMEPMAVSMHFTSAPSDVTGHPGARTTSYVANGDVVSDAGMSGAETRDRWYFIATIDVMAPADAYAVAVLGDSITDGYGVLNEFKRWPDYLNAAINQDDMIKDKVSVLNFGMGANSLTSGDMDMDPGTQRFVRDVLGRQDKIRWLVVLIGVNDLIYGNVAAGPITSAYQSIIDQSHAAGILVYGSPITPFASHTSGAPLNVRTEVNNWVTTSGEFDAVIDLAAAVADSGNPAQLAPAMSNDGLHPNTAGYEAMGNAVDLSLFYSTMQ